MSPAGRDTWLVVHGHFYQPPRENPWTESVPVEPTAAPFHDWNARITAECYRPNAHARIVDDHNMVLAIVSNYELLSFNVGPTLAAWLEREAPDVLAEMIAADRVGRRAIAQAHGHLILPLCDERDVRTQVRWGLADFEHRFGRPARGMWLPETAVNERVLAVLVEEGVEFTILAPSQAAEVRPLAGGDWHDARAALDPRRPYRWLHPDGSGRGLDIVFYDGALSHDVAFGLVLRDADELVARAEASGPRDGQLVCVATDGETFGHHHPFTERGIAYALSVVAPRLGRRTGPLAEYLATHRPTDQVRVHESAWSCAHGVGRWKEDCGCSTGGEPGWNQQWRAPLRRALDVLHAAAREVFERRGAKVLVDPWWARDSYIRLLLGEASLPAFMAEHCRGALDDPGVQVEALTLLEMQRHAMAMYTSCGWFFSDISGLETVQVLRYAARCIDLMEELGEAPPIDEFLEILGLARSNIPEEGTGRDVWERHVVAARVDAERVVAHLALSDVLEQREAPAVVGAFEVTVDHHVFVERGALDLAAGRVTLRHRRTRRRTEHVYAVLHLGALEVVGSTRTAGNAADDARAIDDLVSAFRRGVRVSALLRQIGDAFGEAEFGLEAALPDASDQIVEGAAARLSERVRVEIERIFEDHRDAIVRLATAGYPLPAEIRLPAEMALSRRLETDLVALAMRWDHADYRAALQTVEEARAAGVAVDTNEVRTALSGALDASVARAVHGRGAPEEALGLLALARRIGVSPSLTRSQELVYQALMEAGDPPQAPVVALRVLGRALGLAVDSLGVPR